MLPLLLLASLAIAQVPDSAHVVLVATTDVHGRATGWDYVAQRQGAGGLARVATVVDSLRRRYPGQVMLVDAGDMLQGEAFASYFGRVAPATPHPLVEAMNLAGYDAATPGNHDFDFGVPLFTRAVGDAAFPVVSANIFGAGGDSLIFPAFRVLRRGAVRIGVAGFTTPGTMVWNRDDLRGKLRVGRIEAAAQATLESLRRSSDLAVVLIHSGMSGPASYDTAGIGGEDVAATLAGGRFRPDLVVVGHSHRELADSVVNGVHFVQPRRWGESVSVVHVDLRRVAGRWGVARVRGELVPLAGRPAAPLLAQRLAPQHAAVQEWANEPIGVATGAFTASDARARPTPLHDFVLETLRQRARADLAAGPVFDLRAGFAADTIRRRHVLALYPYDNTLRAVRISGARLKAYLEWSARYFRTDAAGRVSIDSTIPGYDFDILRGASYDIDLRRPVGDRITGLAVRGRPVGPSDSFTLALNSHRQLGSGGYAMLHGAPVVYDRGENIPELLVQEIMARRELDPSSVTPSTWRIAPEVAAVAVRKLYGVPADPLPTSPRDTIMLRILATAGLRGEAVRLVPPLARAMDSLEAECGCPTVRVDAGDALQGGLLANATRGQASLRALDQLGYDAAVAGERDFDWSADTLKRRIAESRRLWVASNVVDSATGRATDLFSPHGAIVVGGLQIAVLGYITPETKTVQPAARTRGLRFGAGELGLHEALAAVKRTGPALTLLLAHERASCDSQACDGELVRLAEELQGSGVDLIVSGHSRGPVETRAGGIPIVAPGGPRSVAVVDVVRTGAGGRSFETRIASLAPDAASSPAAVRALDRLQRSADSLAGHPVARLKRPLARDGGTGALGTLVAEARRNAARADLGLVRAEALAADLPAGPVTYARLAAVEPAAADLVLVTLSGAELRALLEQAVGQGERPPVHLAGATVRYDPRARAGRRIKAIALTGERKLRPEETYTLVTDAETAAGAAGLSGLAARRAERLGVLDVEAVAGYLRRLAQPVEIESAPAFLSTRR